jgi:hypothetical protein
MDRIAEIQILYLFKTYGHVRMVGSAVADCIE